MKRLIILISFILLLTSCERNFNETFYYEVPKEDINKYLIIADDDDRIQLGELYVFFNSYSSFKYNSRLDCFYIDASDFQSLSSTRPSSTLQFVIGGTSSESASYSRYIIPLRYLKRYKLVSESAMNIALGNYGFY